METTKTNEALFEGAKTAEKLFSDVSSAMMEMYNKQLNLTTGMYGNFFNSIPANKGWNGSQMFSDNMFNYNLTKWFSAPFGGVTNSFTNPFTAPFDKVFKQMQTYSSSLFTNFNNETKGNEVNLDAIGKEYKEHIENRLETSKKFFDLISEAYTKQMDFSIETNKKIIEEIKTQFDSAIKQSQKAGTDILQKYQAPVNSEEKKSKEPFVNENKKRTTTPANEFMDHKL